jgi:hypothetical protein
MSTIAVLPRTREEVFSEKRAREMPTQVNINAAPRTWGLPASSKQAGIASLPRFSRRRITPTTKRCTPADPRASSCGGSTVSTALQGCFGTRHRGAEGRTTGDCEGMGLAVSPTLEKGSFTRGAAHHQLPALELGRETGFTDHPPMLCPTDPYQALVALSALSGPYNRRCLTAREPEAHPNEVIRTA